MTTSVIDEQDFPRSSNLACGKYDPTTEILTITFNNGSTYMYEYVPQNVWQGLKACREAPHSAGSYFDKRVKKGGYKYHKLN